MNYRDRARLFTLQVKAGNNFSSKFKIAALCISSFLRERCPQALKAYFDFFARDMLVETDVRFFIRTIYDFFVFSTFWEEELKDLFHFKDGMIFLDVGAHIGKYTLRAATKVGSQGKVIAIEPNKDNFQLLVRNIRINELENCTALNVAAYDVDTEVALHLGPDSAQHSLRRDFGKGSYKVRARTLDAILKDLGVKNVDLIKIDVEGAELEVLRGLEATLTRMNPALIIETLRTDEAKIIQYLDHLAYTGTLCHVFLPYRGGLRYYYFSKNAIGLQRGSFEFED